MPESTTDIHRLVDVVATVIELLAVVQVAVAVIYATGSYLYGRFADIAREARFETYRGRVARALLLGLEILVAADIVRTVVVEPTLRNVMALGLLVLIRTFLSWSLTVELEGRWPWQRGRAK